MSTNTEEKRRLPNELLAEMANAMPAGIIGQDDYEYEDFMDRMQPLSLFIEPHFRKFLSKITNFWRNMTLQQKSRALEWEELAQECELFSSDKKTYEGTPFDQAKDEFDRRFAALDQQRQKQIEQDEELARKVEAHETAWERSKQFTKELINGNKAANENGQRRCIANNNNGGEETVCETSVSRKRKNPAGGNGEEEAESAEEKFATFVCSKKAKHV